VHTGQRHARPNPGVFFIPFVFRPGM
jgi:hypothetical protein